MTSNPSVNNRSAISAARFWATLRSGYEHYSFVVDGKRIQYCYIRKNGCSTFKRLMIDLATGGASSNIPEEDHKSLIDRKFLCRFPLGDLRPDHVVVVVRDPVERIVSLFKNKFIQRSGSKPIEASFTARTGISASDATFSDFVRRYLQNDTSQLDPHVRPQYNHLLPRLYTDVIPLRRLHEGMSHIVSSETSERYFAQKVNAAPQSSSAIANAQTIPASELAQLLAEEGRVPSTSSFLDQELEARIRDIYRRDAVLIQSAKLPPRR